MECIDLKCTWIWGALCSLLVYKPLPRMKWRAPGNSTFLSNSFDNNPLSPWCMARLYQTQTHMCKSITSSLWRLEPDGLAGLGCIALCSAWGNLDRAQHKRQNPPWKGDESSTCYHVALSQEYQDDKDHSHACLQSFLRHVSSAWSTNIIAVIAQVLTAPAALNGWLRKWKTHPHHRNRCPGCSLICP